MNKSQDFIFFCFQRNGNSNNYFVTSNIYVLEKILFFKDIKVGLYKYYVLGHDKVWQATLYDFIVS